MLEHVYIDAATLRRFRSCVLGVHVERFCARLQGLGYDGTTVRVPQTVEDARKPADTTGCR